MTVRPDYDIAVVGAGIVGLAVARELRHRHPDRSVVVLDRETTVGAHQTGHNSGVIHSGVYYRPGSLKARLCVDGAARMYEYCREHDIPYERCGKLIVALDDREVAGLDELERRGRANGVPGVRRVDAAGIREIEPACQGKAALYCPSTGIVDYGRVSRAIEAELRAGGVAFRLGCRVDRLAAEPPVTALETSTGRLTARFVVTCAGLWSDRIAVAAGASPDPRIVPFRGAYLTLNVTPQPVVGTLVYPVPDPALPFLGVHVTKMVDGTVTLGPTALLVGARDGYRLSRVRPRDVADIATWPGVWRMARTYWRTGVAEAMTAASRRRFIRAAARYVPAVEAIGVTGATSAGVRAQAVGRDGSLVDDFVISATPGAVHVRNAPSPAATSSLALAAELVGRIESHTEWPWAA
jgi:(S)-2-hydroxyglutarate dehydrogenase